jgi:hypothetical protein
VSGTTFSNQNSMTHISLYRAHGIAVLHSKVNSFFLKSDNIVFGDFLLCVENQRCALGFVNVFITNANY